MTAKQILKELESLGDKSRRAHNAKNGCGKNQYGVKMGDIRKVAGKIKSNHALAMELWATGNEDARFVATLCMNPKELSAAELEKLVKSLTFAYVADWLNNYIVKKHPAKEALREKWEKAKDKWLARSYWSLTAERVAKDGESLDLDGLLCRIEKEMGKAKPEVQWTMNMCLAEIGIHHAKHRKRAVAIGEKIGLYRDYPVSKGCTSPFAPIWINEMIKRQK